jgi:hypothetical protein
MPTKTEDEFDFRHPSKNHKWATDAKDWPTHSIPPKNLQKQNKNLIVLNGIYNLVLFRLQRKKRTPPCRMWSHDLENSQVRKGILKNGDENDLIMSEEVTVILTPKRNEM